MPKSFKEWPPVPGDPDIPSWSWATHDGPVKFHGSTWFGYQGPWAKVDCAYIIRAETNLFGRVSGGELALYGDGQRFTLSEENALPADYVHKDQLDRVWEFSSKCYSLWPGMMIYFDNVHWLEGTEFVCLQVGVGRNIRGTSHNADVGFVLLPVLNGKKFRRVGMFDVSLNRDRWQRDRKAMRVDII
jgi:hypothetical protein